MYEAWQTLDPGPIVEFARDSLNCCSARLSSNLPNLSSSLTLTALIAMTVAAWGGCLGFQETESWGAELTT
jgi:hypothetical protein